MRMNQLTNDALTRLFNSRQAALFLGKPGVGKTERIQQYCRDMGLGIVDDFDLTSVDAPDIRGFAVPHKKDDGTATTVFTRSPILEAIERTGKDQGVLFLDELLQSEHIVQKAVAPLLSARRAGEHYLPDGWVVWAASNRAMDRAGVNRILGHVTNRLTYVNIDSDVEGWIHWANNNGIHPMYAAFAQHRPGVVFDAEPAKSPDQPFCTPRSFTNACRYHTQDVDSMHLPTDEVSREFVAGFIGEGAAAEFFSFAKVANELPSIEEVLADPTRAKVPEHNRLDAQYAAMQLTIHHAEAKTIDPLFKYLLRLNKELQTSAAQQLIKKSGGALLNSVALTNWIRENKALITATLQS